MSQVQWRSLRRHALRSTSSGKAPGKDVIPLEVLKQGGHALREQLLRLYNACWQNMCLPKDFKDALIVTICNKKGDRNACGNQRGISLLSVAGKILAKIILNSLKTITEEVLPESKCGFRSGRSTTDMIFTLRHLQEKAIEQHQPLCVVFVDRETLWKVLEKYRCPDKLVSDIKIFYDGMAGKLSVGGEPSDAFTVNHGVKQECVLAPTLFSLSLSLSLSLCLTAVLETMNIDLNNGV